MFGVCRPLRVRVGDVLNLAAVRFDEARIALFTRRCLTPYIAQSTMTIGWENRHKTKHFTQLVRFLLSKKLPAVGAPRHFQCYRSNDNSNKPSVDPSSLLLLLLLFPTAISVDDTKQQVHDPLTPLSAIEFVVNRYVTAVCR